jgi:hypothetical protein
MKKVFTVILALLVVLGGGGYLLAEQADAAEPGDTLYSVDLLAESVQRLITLDELKKAELETDILEERMTELESVSETDMDLTDVLSAVSAQQDRVREHLGNLESNPEKYQDGELEQVRNRYQEKIEQHIQVMEKVQNKGEDSAIQIKQQLEVDLENCRSGNCTLSPEETGNPDSPNGNSTEDGGNQGGNEDAGNQGGSDNGQGGNPNN